MKVNKISPASGTAITLGDSGDTFTIPSGATIANSGTATGFLADNAVTTAKIADNAVTLAKMAGGTDGQIITYDASGDPVAVGPGTDGQVLTSTGAGSPPAFEDAGGGGPTLGTAQATTSAGSKTFSGIPSGTKNIIISWNEISTAVVTSMQVRLGDSGGVESSGYYATSQEKNNSSTASESSTSGFMVSIQGSGRLLTGHMFLTLLDASSHLWISSHSAKLANDRVVLGGGAKTLSAELTQLYIVLDSNSYDAGSINIMYW